MIGRKMQEDFFFIFDLKSLILLKKNTSFDMVCVRFVVTEVAILVVTEYIQTVSWMQSNTQVPI